MPYIGPNQQNVGPAARIKHSFNTFIWKQLHLPIAVRSLTKCWFSPKYSPCLWGCSYGLNYYQVSDIRRTLLSNKIVEHSDVVGASPVGAAPTTSWLSTYLASLDWAKTTARRDEKYLNLGIWCGLYYKFYSNSIWPGNAIWWHRSGSTLAQVLACLPIFAFIVWVDLVTPASLWHHKGDAMHVTYKTMHRFFSMHDSSPPALEIRLQISAS